MDAVATDDDTTTPVEDEIDDSHDERTNSSSASAADNKWPGWPGCTVFRVIVPASKVGTIIGRKGDLIKKLCEDTRARVRILEPPPIPTTDRIVLVWAKEELEEVIPPAMDAVMRIFKRVNGLLDNDAAESNNVPETVGSAFSSLRLLAASAQVLSLLGKKGSLIKSIQDGSGASVRILSEGSMPAYIAKDERVIELQGEAKRVHKALDRVLGHLRKYLVDQSVIPLFEKTFSIPIAQERQLDVQITNPVLHTVPHSGVGSEYSVPTYREIYLEHDGQLERKFPFSADPLYDSDSVISGIRSSGIANFGSSFVTQVTKTMQIPLAYAEDIIGISGTNIAYIRRTSGAVLTVQESKGLPEEITVEIKGTSSQVQIAQRLIQDFISNHNEQVVSDYGYLDMGLRSSFLPHSQLASSSVTELEYSKYVASEIPDRLGSSGTSDLGNTFRL